MDSSSLYHFVSADYRADVPRMLCSQPREKNCGTHSRLGRRDALISEFREVNSRLTYSIGELTPTHRVDISRCPREDCGPPAEDTWPAIVSVFQSAGNPILAWAQSLTIVATSQAPAFANGENQATGITGPDTQVLSTTSAVGPLALTEAMPFSIAAAPEYISLLPMTWPLPAFRLK